MIYRFGNLIFAGPKSSNEPSMDEAVAMIDKVIKIQNAASDTPTIDIDGFIGDLFWEESKNTVKAIRAKLKEISALKAKKIIVNINSPGGFVDAGLGIHDILAAHKAEIETNVEGLTASMATVIAQAGSSGMRRMSDNALFLIHEPMNGGFHNVTEAEQNLENMKKVRDRLVNIYSKRNSISSEEDVRELMKADNGNGKWIDADEALELGYIDAIYEPMKAAATVIDPDVKAKLRLPDLPKPADKGPAATNDDNLTTDDMKKELLALLAKLTGLLTTKKEGSDEDTITDEAQTVIDNLQAQIDKVGNQEEQIDKIAGQVTTLGDQVKAITTEKETATTALETANASIDTLKTD
ncbi:Clp protease ClpP, partial [Candidatus Pacearchaeota archaeon]|nr:Clp protease ClpP [Candidatus Pacearchaeota archaeon]